MNDRNNGTVRMVAVYTGGTVDALRHFVPPLLAHTPWSFELVLNGVSDTERATMAALAATSPRLALHDMRSSSILPLGEVLRDRLARPVPDAAWVGVLDSDILLTDDVAGIFDHALREHDAVFSAPPIWLTAPLVLDADRTEIAGPYRITADGLILGSSYLAIYRQDALRAVMTACAVTIDKYLDTAAVDPDFQTFLVEHDLGAKVWEPAKLLNLAFTAQGRPVAIVDEPDRILHIGGFSYAAFNEAMDRHPDAVPESHSRHHDITDYRDHRPYMPLKRDVGARLGRSYTRLAGGQPPDPEIRFTDRLESRVRQIEDHWRGCLAPQ